MDFTAFDTSGTDAYAAEAKARWGDTAAYKEYERKTAGQSDEALRAAGAGVTELLAAFGALKEKPASDPAVQAQVKALQDFISAHFYQCSDEVLAGLGQMYGAGGEFTDNIDAAAGEGTAVFASRAIAAYCSR